jgi:phage gpG-like protein
MVDATQQHFRDAQDPFGRAWAPLQPAYAEFKRGPGILRERAMRGGLMGSLTFKIEGDRALAWGSGKIYAAVHQFGAVIVPVRANALTFRIGKRVIHAKRVTVPARPYLGMGPLEQRVALEATFETYREAMRGE